MCLFFFLMHVSIQQHYVFHQVSTIYSQFWFLCIAIFFCNAFCFFFCCHFDVYKFCISCHSSALSMFVFYCLICVTFLQWILVRLPCVDLCFYFGWMTMMFASEIPIIVHPYRSLNLNLVSHWSSTV